MSDIPNDLLPRVAVLEEIARTTKAALERIERRLDAMDSRFDRMDARLDRMVSDQRADFRWVLGIMLGGFAGLLGVMARGFHWL